MINPKLKMPLTDTKEFPITGYLSRLSERPGGRLSAFVSTTCTHFDAKLVRVVSGDPNPKSLGVAVEDLAHVWSATIEGGRQAIRAGSWVEVEDAPRSEADSPLTWSALCWTQSDPEQDATILAHDGRASAVTLSVNSGAVRVELRSEGATFSVTAPFPWRSGSWTIVWLSLDPKTARVGVGAAPMSGEGVIREAESPFSFGAPSGGSATFAARAEAPRFCFTGKIEAPTLYKGYASGLAWTTANAELEPLAAWDFSQFISTSQIAGVGREGRPGRTINDPTRAVIGSTWSGHETCWRHAPEQYAAIHFHADDIGAFDWRETFTFTVPDTLKSGAYALHVSCAEGEDYLPFYVLPRKGAATAKMVFLAPTYTYLAYANCFFGNMRPRGQARAASWGASPYNGAEYGSYGRSTYNWHVDGSGVALSSRLRPMLSMRPGFVYADDPKGSGVRHYPADTHLLSWLEAKGFEFDVVTDEDLDDEGVDLIMDYAAVITGTHPEYHTTGTLDALQAYLARGGNLAYLGANGFYWRIARDRQRPDLIEVRRAEAGIRLWAAESGEYFHAIDGQLGGLWRRNGRFPQSLTGIGFSAQGPFDASYFRRTDASWSGPAAWIFEGVEGDVIGDYGLSAGGAAGFELDRMDFALGSPPSSIVVASSEGLPSTFSVVPEDMLTESLSLNGEAPQDLVRADMTYTAMPGGGAIFAAGSITFCGSLWRDKSPEGSISKVLENVLTRFTAAPV